MCLGRATRLFSVLLILLTLAACVAAPPPVSKPRGDALRVATYNVHYIDTLKESGAWSLKDWARRKGPFDAAIKALEADIIGFQEMESFEGGSIARQRHQLEWTLSQNPEFKAASVGDDPEIFPSTQPILYRHARLKLLDQGWFFFSETPDRAYSRTFNGGYPAFASWAQFEERGTGARLRVYNVHFDYASGKNRRHSAELTATRAKAQIDAGESVIVLGDLNTGPRSKPGRILRGAGLDFAPFKGSTWHWNRGWNLTAPVDHIAATPDLERIGPVIVLRRRFMGEWPSDHYPVAVDYRLP